MSAIQDAVCEFVSNVAEADPESCRCGGYGWISTPFDSWKTCPAHFNGQAHPESNDWQE